MHRLLNSKIRFQMKKIYQRSPIHLFKKLKMSHIAPSPPPPRKGYKINVFKSDNGSTDFNLQHLYEALSKFRESDADLNNVILPGLF